MLEIQDQALTVKIGEAEYNLRPTFGAMVALTRLQDQLQAEDGNSPAKQMETLSGIKEVILKASDIPDAVFNGLSGKSRIDKK